jgi:hypothetical protein
MGSAPKPPPPPPPPPPVAQLVEGQQAARATKKRQTEQLTGPSNLFLTKGQTLGGGTKVENNTGNYGL